MEQNCKEGIGKVCVNTQMCIPDDVLTWQVGEEQDAFIEAISQ